jgi:hypothetical protein
LTARKRAELDEVRALLENSPREPFDAVARIGL